MDKIEIRCPICNKWIAEKEKDAETRGIMFWCVRCKKKIIVEKNSARVASKQ